MVKPFEHVLLNSYKEQMISYMGSHPEAIDEAIQLALSNRQPHAWRAAWLLRSMLGENDMRLRAHTKRIVEVLPTRPDNHQRELLNLLLLMEIGEDDQGYLFDHCLTLWEKVGKAPSVRLTALRVIIQIVRRYPELAQEVLPLTQDHYLDNLSPGVRKAVGRMMSVFS